MKQYDAYLFDWDGTLAETLEVWVEILREAFDAYGLKPTDDEIVSCIGNFKARPQELGIRTEDYSKFSEMVQEASRERVPAAPLYPGALDLLTMLRANGKKLALITSGWRITIDVILRKHDLLGLFDVVITGDDVREHKPHAEPLLAALEQLSISKDKALMLGDSDKDLGAAKNAGVDSLLFYPPSHQLLYRLEHLEEHKPTYVIDGWGSMSTSKWAPE